METRLRSGWRQFRELPWWAQAVVWVVAWPLVLAWVLAIQPRWGAVAKPAAVLVLVVGAAGWFGVWLPGVEPTGDDADVAQAPSTPQSSPTAPATSPPSPPATPSPAAPSIADAAPASPPATPSPAGATSSEPEPATAAPESAPPGSSDDSSDTVAAQGDRACQSGDVDVNAAGPAELQRITHIGPARAEDVVALRPFASVGDLARVDGIADSRLADIREQGLACAG